MTKEIDIFKSKEIESFNGSSLSTNLNKTELIIAELSDDFRIHNHSNSQFVWNKFILNHKGGIRNIRQITAEINKKQMALNEAKYNYSKKVAELEMIKSSVANGKLDNYASKLANIEIEHIKHGINQALSPVEGAVKDIITLKKSYDELMEKYKGYSEAEFEVEEIAYWIRRLFSQALADIRECGSVRAGNQLSIEQMGFNVSFVIKILSAFTVKESGSDDSTNKLLDDFLDDCVNKFSEQVKNFTGHGGITGKLTKESIYSAA